MLCVGVLKHPLEIWNIPWSCLIFTPKKRSIFSKKSSQDWRCTTLPSWLHRTYPLSRKAENTLTKLTSLLPYIFAVNSSWKIYLRPLWKACSCNICYQSAIDLPVHEWREQNKRLPSLTGYHNAFNFAILFLADPFDLPFRHALIQENAPVWALSAFTSAFSLFIGFLT